MKFRFLILFLMIATGAWAQTTTVNIATYGGAGDCTNLTGVVTTSGSGTITCSTANFVPGCVGAAMEVEGAGTFQTISNQTLFAHIVTYNSATSVTLDRNAGASLMAAQAWYGTDDTGPLTNAIGHASSPLAVITGPHGNYLLLPTNCFSTSGYNGTIGYTIPLTRGGYFFSNDIPGTFTFTGMEGWVNNGTSAQRSGMFSMQMPMTDNNPIIFSNIDMDGGVSKGNIQNLSYPASGSTGLGWDGTHHWLITVAGTGTIIDQVFLYNANVKHWRGEMQEDTSGTSNLFFTAINCNYFDGDASCINNFAHNLIGCTFSNANQTEEFYRTTATNASFMSSCTNENMTGSAVIAVNGGFIGNPPYTINNCLFTNNNDVASVILIPGTYVNYLSNTLYQTYGIGPDDNGFQGGAGVSNIVVAYNNCQSAFLYYSQSGTFGTSNWIPQGISIYSNNFTGTGFSAITGGYGYSSNYTAYLNYGGGNGPNQQASTITGQWCYEQTNNALAYWTVNGGSSVATNLVAYSDGCFFKITGGVSGSIFDMDNSSPWRIPPGVPVIVTNSTALSFPFYGTTNITGTPLTTIATGTAITVFWNAGADAWLTTPPTTAVFYPAPGWYH